MTQKISVIGTIVEAIQFVFSNWGECLFRALPILFLVAAVSYLQNFLGGILLVIAKLSEPFLYAMFAVSWHRFSILKSERLRKGLPYKLGKRELKFGALSVASTFLFAFSLQSLASLLPPLEAIITFLVILVPVTLTLIFIYPAIALDQPLRLSLFFMKGVRQITSFVIAFVIVGVIAFSIAGLASLALPLLIKLISPDAVKLMTFIVGQLVLTPVFLALMASTASFLYRDVIGIETTEPKAPDQEIFDASEDQS